MNTLDFKEGQTYICIKPETSWWTVGKEYPVFLNHNRIPVIIDNQGDEWPTGAFRNFSKQFILKEMYLKVDTDKQKYSAFDVTKVILKAYNMYDNDAQRLAFIKGYFAK